MGYRNKRSLKKIKKSKKMNKRTVNKFKNTGYENIIKGGAFTPPKAIAPDNLVDPRAHQKCKKCNTWINQGQDKSTVCSQYECQYCPICIDPQSPEPEQLVLTSPSASIASEPEQLVLTSPSASIASEPEQLVLTSPSASIAPEPEQLVLTSPSASIASEPEQLVLTSPSASIASEPEQLGETTTSSDSLLEQPSISPSSSESQQGDSVYSTVSSEEGQIDNIDDFLDQVIIKLQEILDL